MARVKQVALTVVTAIWFIGSAASAEPERERGAGEARAAPPRAAPPRAAEPHEGPRGYARPAEPSGWNARPTAPDRGAYQHNFQAARAYRIGPYRAPRGWVARRWAYGEILPRTFWASQYILADYWLFGLEVPPVGYEWVRYGSDALLIDINTGEVLQTEYGVFG